jgi:deazaflavin-dependent oxidoreductase (nitroreductase family)
MSGCGTEGEQPCELLGIFGPLLHSLGTRSVPEVRRRILVLINRAVNAVVHRLGLRRFRGAPLLHLTTTGRKTGARRTTPLIHLADGDRWIVVASNGGADWEPGWWLNLRAGGTGTVEVDGRTVEVRGHELTGAEGEAMWRRLVEEVFDYEQYQRKVARQIAVVALTPAGPS